MLYTDSKLFQRTLGVQSQDTNAEVRDKLRAAYQSSRNVMTHVLDKIATDFPNLTVHDISHVDSLWFVTDVIIGDTYPISPLEGFILGCAFLIHDSALSYEAIGGKEKLRQHQYWRDSYMELSHTDNISEEERERKADFETIRYIHAKEAENIITQAYQAADGESFYILEDTTLRNHFSVLIGKIAASHHWSIEQVATLPTQFNVIDGFPRDWRINPLKLACILRCADAGHIDTGRAPDYLYSTLHLHGISAQHWNAQNHLAVIDVDRSRADRAIITSTHPFKESEFGAWNVAFDAIRTIDFELKASNKLLQSQCPDDGGMFAIHEIAGATSKEELAKYITTEGWEPFEANLHIDDVSGVIAKLGGEALYGNEDKILTAIRELIQNARDAIHARYIVEPDFVNSGRIDIHIYQNHGDTYVSIADNGIGMSENVLKNCFLNFGCSLWNSSLIKTEHSGLLSSNFRAVGKYGIGFYAIFMVASSADVMTRVYNKGTDSTLKLKFPSGLTLTPIKQKVDSGCTNISTKVTFKIDSSIYAWDGRYTIKRNAMNESNFITSFENVLKTLCAGLDTNVFYHENEQPPKKIHQDISCSDFDKRQWLRDISFADDQANPNLDNFIEENYQRLEYIKKDGRICALAAINILPSFRQDFLSLSTIGGLASSGQIHSRSSEHYIGYMDSIPSAANRTGVSPMNVYKEEIIQWAKRQYEKVKPFFKAENRLYIPYSLSTYEVDTIDTCLVYTYTLNFRHELVSITQCIQRMKEGKRLVFLLSSYFKAPNRHMEVYVQLSEASKILNADDILMWPIRNSEFLNVSPDRKYTLYSFIKRAAENNHIEIAEYTQETILHTVLGSVDALYIQPKESKDQAK